MRGALNVFSPLSDLCFYPSVTFDILGRVTWAGVNVCCSQTLPKYYIIM